MTPKFQLTRYSPDGSTSQWSLATGRVVLGHDAECEVHIQSAGVAPRHVSLELSPGSVLVRNLSSGSLSVDGEEVSDSVKALYPVSLQCGDAFFSVAEVLEKPVGARERARSGQSNGWLPNTDGEHRLLREFARGGMSRIYEGTDPQLKRSVAVKVSRRSGGTGDVRFFREAEVLGQLAHPNIVPVYSLGRDAAGHPAYSMKLVNGRTLQSILDGLRQGDEGLRKEYTQARLLTIFLKVCDAVSFAHSRGYLHRDLKPENVMVGEFGEVLVMDWGLAMLLEGERETLEGRAESSEAEQINPLDFGRTLDGDLVGTPQYMSPEQMDGSAAKLGFGSDVYALGAMLYAILTGRPPVEGDSLGEIVAKVREGQLAPMVHGWGGIAHRIPDALVAVTRRAMARKPEERYGSVLELAEEITAYQSGYATSAENAGFVRHLLLFMGRYRLASALVGLLVVSAVAFLLRLTASEQRANASAELARAQEQRALENEKTAVQERETANRLAADAQILLAEAHWKALDGEQLEWTLETVPEGLRDDRWKYIKDEAFPKPRYFEAPGSASLRAVVPDLRAAGSFFVGYSDGSIRQLNVQGTESRVVAKLNAGSRTWRMAASKNGEVLAVTRLHFNGTQFVPDQNPEIYATADGKKLGEVQVNESVRSLFLSGDGKVLIVCRWSLQMIAWDVENARMLWEKPYAIPHTSSNPILDGSGTILVYEEWGRLKEVDLRTGEVKRTVFEGVERDAVCINSDESFIYVALRGTVKKMNPKDGSTVFQVRPGGNEFLSLVHIPAVDALVTIAMQTERCMLLQFWSDTTGSLLHSYMFNVPKAAAAVHPLSADVAVAANKSLATWHHERTLPWRSFKLSAANIQGKNTAAFLGEPWRVMRSHSSVFGGGHVALEVLDLREKDEQMIRHINTQSGIRFFSTTADGSLVAQLETEIGTVPVTKRVRIFRREGESLIPVREFGVDPNASQCVLSPSGKSVWLVSGIYETATGQCLSTFDRTGFREIEQNLPAWVGEDLVLEVAGSPKDSGNSERLVLWNAKAGTPALIENAPTANAVAMSPDQRWVAEAGGDYMIRIRDSSTLKVVRQFRAHDAPIKDVAWHPTLPFLVSTSDDLSIRFWETVGFSRRYQIQGLEERGETLDISPDGTAVAVFSRKHWKVSIWLPEIFKKRS